MTFKSSVSNNRGLSAPSLIGSASNLANKQVIHKIWIWTFAKKIEFLILTDLEEPLNQKKIEAKVEEPFKI